MSSLDEMEKQAQMLARDNREGEPTIQRIFWFPDPEEIHLVELTPVVPVTIDGEVRPFYFRGSPQDGYPAPSGVAMIRPEEFGKLKLPKGWPAWNEAVEILTANDDAPKAPPEVPQTTPASPPYAPPAVSPRQIQIRPFSPADQTAVIDLWRRCGLVVPHNDPAKDIQRKLADSPDLFLVAELAGTVVGVVMAGYEGHRGWINYLAVAPDRRRQGIGRQLMAAAESKLRALACPKINLQIRRSNSEVIAFYQRLGFAEDNVISLGKRLAHDQRNGTPYA